MPFVSRSLVVLMGLATLHCSPSDAAPPPQNALPPLTYGGSGGFSVAAAGTPGSGGYGVGSGGAASAAGASTGSGGYAAQAGGSGSGGTTASGGSENAAGGMSAAGGRATPSDDGIYTLPGFQNLAPSMGQALDEHGTPLDPPAPMGWTYYQIEGAICRDGSPAGFFLRKGTSDKLLWYLEGGGACDTPGFCVYNPANVNQVLAGNGQTVAGSIGGATPGRQQPGTDGVFDVANPANPFKDWSQIYTPYCTGDVYFGTRENTMVPGLPTPQQFVGHRNMQKFVSRIVPTFKGKLSRVVISGASAGGFGAALNFSMIQDAFAGVRVDVLDDSGPPMADPYMFACMQKRWRDLWGFEASLPTDCEECKQPDGGGLLHLADFLLRKHPHAMVAAISGMQDEIIRLFFSAGLRDCATFETADPVAITIGQLDQTVYMPGQTYADGLLALRTQYASTHRLATYFIGGTNITFHQHIWRPEFYQALSGGVTEAQWVTDFLNGKPTDIGP